MKKGGFHTNTPVHDPAVFVDKDGEYYIFGTHMAAATLFTNLFDKDMKAFEFCGKFNGEGYAVWAPDVSYNPYLEKYVMYFCTSGSYIKSSICMATADCAKGPYTFCQTILSSGFDKETASKSNIYDVLGKDADLSRYLKKNGNYNNLAWPKCIDPNIFMINLENFGWFMVHGLGVYS